MRRALILAAMVAAGFLSRDAQAAGWSGDVKIKTIEVSNVGAPGVWLSFTSPVSHTCTSQNGQFWLGGGPDNVNKMQSIATTAMVSSRPVTVYVGSTCSGGYPVLLGITVK